MKFIKINPIDNVAVALEDLRAGDTISGHEFSVTLRDDVARGHKVALSTIELESPVVKYGFPIGHATTTIHPGDWVHSHNLATSLGDNLEYHYNPVTSPIVNVSDEVTFEGYPRYDGNVGVRNDLWIIPTVGCVNGTANSLAALLRQEYASAPGVDDIVALTHPYGCSQLGGDHADTRSALAALATHPNAGGVLIIGLGCENNQIDALREAMEPYDPERVRFIVSQQVDDEIEEGLRLGRELLDRMSRDHRVPCPVSTLRIGLKCGGSDGLSGITANPLVGLLSDWLIAHGASTVLTEVPEMFGAETLLMNRATGRDIFDLTVNLINDFKEYFRASGLPIYENPSPGNKKGGITTLEEKSLGCVQKGGTAPVVNVLRYAGRLRQRGLTLLEAPGNDLVASTALAISGCQIVLFTTGRGTPFGTCVPTMKISTNSELARHKSTWIDFNAGTMVEGETSHQALQRLVAQVLDIASGERVNQERHRHKEISIFKRGVTL